MDWIDDFILNEALVCSSDTSELHTKALCEYVMFCYILVKHNKSINKPLLLKIKKQESIQHYQPLLLLCLGEELQLNFHSNNCLEKEYIKSIASNYADNTYWIDFIKDFLAYYLNNNLDIDGIYFLTHLLFYATDFGTNPFLGKLSRRYTNAIVDIIGICIVSCRSEKNWDLLRELYICLICLGKEDIREIKNAMALENLHIKSRQGWYLSDGSNKIHYENNYDRLTFKEKYSLFHTTIICEILNIKIQR